MIQAARAAVDAEGHVAAFTVASMTNLPYASRAFNAVLCLWSAFNELLEEGEQMRTIAEMWRVLDRGGFALIEGRPYEEPTAAEVQSGTRRGPEHRIEWGLVEGILNPHYGHDEHSLRRICETAGVHSYRISESEWGGRQRLLLRFDKAPA